MLNQKHFNGKENQGEVCSKSYGPLHIGGVRTALYNYLFAKKLGGDFILRIEDTDQNRFVPGAEEYIIESLEWCGIKFNEGVHIGGPYAPYRQSERKNMYKQYADILLKKDMPIMLLILLKSLKQKEKNTKQKNKHFNILQLIVLL